MNIKYTHSLLAFIASLSFAIPASATLIVNDTFDVGTPTIGNDAGDPNDITWVGGVNNTSVSNNSGGTAPGTGNYLDNNASTGFSMIRGSLPIHSLLDIGIGDTITLTFDFVYYAGTQSSADGLRFGLFNSTGFGTVVGAGVGGSQTGLRIAHDANATIDSNMGSGTNGMDDFLGGSDVALTGTMSSSIDTSVVNGSLSISRLNATTLSISTAINGGLATVTDVDDIRDDADYLTNFSGGFVMIRNGNVNRDFRVDNVRIYVIPEPSSIAMIVLGFSALFMGRKFRRS
jgi:hypothetical protein